MERNCDWCKHKYIADKRNLKRGWGLCCSKSCSAKKREKRTGAYSRFLRGINKPAFKTVYQIVYPSGFSRAIEEKMRDFEDKEDLINYG